MRVSIVALLALLLGAGIAAPTGESAGAAVTTDLNGEDARLTLPTGEPVGLVMWFHGQGGGVLDRVEGPFLRSLTRSGYAIASSSFHLQAWGNAASTDDAVRLTEWAEQQTGLPVSVWVSGSMGGATSLNAMLHGVTPPPCWYGVKPAISLNRMENVPTGVKFIRQAFGGPVPEDRNPIKNVDELPEDVRYRVVASPEDDWVPEEENGGALVDELTARGVEATFVAASGPHEDASHFDSGDLLEFVQSCQGSTTSASAAD